MSAKNAGLSHKTLPQVATPVVVQNSEQPNPNTQKKIQFYIKDSGIGISSGKINIIFDRFRQADDSHTRIFGGTGLGLAISKNIAKLLQGDIHAVSTVGNPYAVNMN